MDQCLKQSRSPHVAPTVGAIGGILGLDQSKFAIRLPIAWQRAFAYCVARDLVSAAVRLSLIGALASAHCYKEFRILPMMEFALWSV
jgi:urease accessory protein UreF